MDPQLIAQKNLSSYGGPHQTHADDYISSDTSAEWFDGDEDSDSKAYGPGGYLRVRIGDKLHNRYVIESKLGWGHFSTVWLSTDLLAPEKSPRRFVALKIQKSAPHYLDAAKDEVQLLSAAKRKSESEPENYVVQMVDSFIVSASNGKHVVFVFEVLGPNLLSLIKAWNYRGIPMAVVKKIARDVLLGLDHLHAECAIIHTDLKPENVLISRTSPIDLEQLRRDKNRQLKTQHQRQLGRFQQSLDGPNHSLSKAQRRKLSSKVIELRANIAELDREWTAMLCTLGREQKENDSDVVNGSSSNSSSNTVRNGSDGHKSKTSNASNAAKSNLKRSESAQSPQSPKGSKHGKHENRGNDENEGNAVEEPLRAQFSWLHGRSVEDGSMLDADDERLKVPMAKLCDLGNACWSDKHFTDDITTRQYRAPESMVGVGYDFAVDIWSLAAMLFELITGDYLFDPREKAAAAEDEGYCRDEDHLALIGELCGHLGVDGVTEHTPWPVRWTLAGDERWQQRPVVGKDAALKALRGGIRRPGNVDRYFGGHKVVRGDDGQTVWEWTERGDQLTRIQKLDYWSLAAVLEQKYKIPRQRRPQRECVAATSGHEEAIPGSLAHFLGKMLSVDPRKRATAREMLDHQWLTITEQDVEHCLNAEIRWFQSGGKPVVDTNAHDDGDDDEDDGGRSRPTPSDRAANGDVDGSSGDGMDSECSLSGSAAAATAASKRKAAKGGHGADGGESMEWRWRSRDSSVSARDEFAGRRAESEPPPTWHRNAAIPWYRQFDEVVPTMAMGSDHGTDDDDEDDSDSESASTADLDANFKALRLNGARFDDEDGGDERRESESDDDDDDDDDDIDVDGDRDDDDEEEVDGDGDGVESVDDSKYDERSSGRRQHYGASSSIVFHGDIDCSPLPDGAEDKDEEDLEPMMATVTAKEEEEEKGVSVEPPSAMKEDEDFVGDEVGDDIASLRHFPRNGQDPRFRAPSASLGSSHSRASSSASTLDID